MMSTTQRSSIFDFLKRKKKTPTQNLNEVSLSSCDGLDETYLFDFKNYSSGYGGFVVSVSQDEGDNSMGENNSSQKSVKIRIKPKTVLAELETMPTPFSLIGIDEKISILKEKASLIVQRYAKREVLALIERLENRKKYIEHKAFFDNYSNTTDEKIDALLDKYDLVMKTSDIFIPEFPDEAIKTMMAYTEKLKVVCEKKPVFYVIAEPDKFKEAYKKRDPILLVQSPFGFYWQILGAWDEELMLLSEL